MPCPPSQLRDEDALYAALLVRDPAFDGHAFVCVTSTRIFCRLMCSARKSKREKHDLHASIRACIEAGFRPCLRCRPLDLAKRREPIVAELLDQLDRRPAHRCSEQDVTTLGMDPRPCAAPFGATSA